jgi:hypothetical protein
MKFDLRAEVAAERQALREAYLRRPTPRTLLAKHTQLVDRTVKTVWGETGVAPEAASSPQRLPAGDSSPAPTSISVLLGSIERSVRSLERVGRLWDIGLEGHSVRTVSCAEAAAASPSGPRCSSPVLVGAARFSAGEAGADKPVASSRRRSSSRSSGTRSTRTRPIRSSPT